MNAIDKIEEYLSKLFLTIPLTCQLWFYQQLNLSNPINNMVTKSIKKINIIHYKY